MQYTATASSGESVSFAIETLPQAFARIPDPRRKQGTRYSLATILSLAVVVVLANHTSVLAIAEWAARPDFGAILLPTKPPSSGCLRGLTPPMWPQPSSECLTPACLERCATVVAKA
jgi:hypothetical protein